MKTLKITSAIRFKNIITFLAESVSLCTLACYYYNKEYFYGFRIIYGVYPEFLFGQGLKVLFLGTLVNTALQFYLVQFKNHFKIKSCFPNPTGG